MVRDNFSREFRLDNSKSQLSDKYRVEKIGIERVLKGDEEHQEIYDIFTERSNKQKSVTEEIRQKFEKRSLNELL